MRIRDFVPSDAHQLVQILKANQQYGHPEEEGRLSPNHPHHVRLAHRRRHRLKLFHAWVFPD
jgi:hypothetical protein